MIHSKLDVKNRLSAKEIVIWHDYKINEQQEKKTIALFQAIKQTYNTLRGITMEMYQRV